MAIQGVGASAASVASMDAVRRPAAQLAAEAPGASGVNFGEMLGQAVTTVNRSQLEARDALQGLASGEHIDLHGTMISLEKAEISLRAMTSVRDRLVSVYEQVMNMAI